MSSLTRTPTAFTAVAGTWTPSSGTQLAAIQTADDIYVNGAANSDIFEAGFTAFALGAADTISNVRVSTYVRGATTSSCSYQAGIKIGGTIYYGATQAMTSVSFATFDQDWATNPAGGSWTPAAVNSIAAMACKTIDANPDVYVSYVEITVTYVAGPKTQSLSVSASAIAGVVKKVKPQRGATAAITTTFGRIANLHRTLSVSAAAVATVAKKTKRKLAAATSALINLLPYSENTVMYRGFVSFDTRQMPTHTSTVTIPVGATHCVMGAIFFSQPAQGSHPDFASVSLGGVAGELIHKYDGDPTSWAYEWGLYYEFKDFGTGDKTFTFTMPNSGGYADGMHVMLFFSDGVNSIAHSAKRTASYNVTETTPSVPCDDKSLVLGMAPSFGSSPNTYADFSVDPNGLTILDQGLYHEAEYGCAYRRGTGTSATVTAHGSTWGDMVCVVLSGPHQYQMVLSMVASVAAGISKKTLHMFSTVMASATAWISGTKLGQVVPSLTFKVMHHSGASATAVPTVSRRGAFRRTLAAAASVVAGFSTQKLAVLFYQSLAAAASAVATIKKKTRRRVAGSGTGTATMVRKKAKKRLASAASATTTIVKKTKHRFATVTSIVAAAVLTSKRGFRNITLAASAAVTTSFSRVAHLHRSFGASASVVPNAIATRLGRFYTKSLAAAASATATIRLRARKRLAMTSTVVMTLQRKSYRRVASIAAAVAGVTKKTRRRIAGSGTGTALTTAFRVARTWIQSVAASANATADISRRTRKTIAITTSATANVNKKTSVFKHASSAVVTFMAWMFGNILPPSIVTGGIESNSMAVSSEIVDNSSVASTGIPSSDITVTVEEF